MSLVGGFPHHPVVHHDGYSSSFAAAAAAAAAASRCHEESPYFHGWLIGHADMSPPPDYGMAPSSYSPEYTANNAAGGVCAPGPGLEHGPYGAGGAGALVPGMMVVPRTVKRRPTANRKERRRTQSINSAFAELRECIPNVPADTKLSKIKTLRLATSYIAYLMDILDKHEQHGGGETEAFKAEFRKADSKEERRKKETNEVLKCSGSSNDKKPKGRTGWPQHVWALELKQ
ncbi:hypothetical protein QTP70_033846 [Hemibagrus guttatus]|uniref:Heart- and neural crest derivatives-expressed protein 2 n=2 Tax=Siluroidei TaxID=1489793 RepID=A0AAE0VF10_9TELE|nr:hypothetical protein QTP70_033846 [Hemibagrus guttatus]KAK3573685.1 hypothetical protein QTP86_031889 [Hemibagrus guttatus]MCJ8730198.1 hypothetical protein [Pangasius djambal]